MVVAAVLNRYCRQSGRLAGVVEVHTLSITQAQRAARAIVDSIQLFFSGSRRVGGLATESQKPSCRAASRPVSWGSVFYFARRTGSCWSRAAE